jgi:hypothetical protein
LWVKWDILCLQRENKGLGVRRLKEFNLSLLGKWVWMILEERGSLWYRVLSVKYGEERGRLYFGGGGGSVLVAKLESYYYGGGMLDDRWLLDNISRQVGMGFYVVLEGPVAKWCIF